MKRERRGEGWEEREVSIPETSEEQRDAFKQYAESWNASLAEGGGAFGAVSLPALRICEKTLEDVPRVDGRPAPRSGSPQAYALKIVKEIEGAKKRVTAGEADEAARFAWRAGFEFAYAMLKFQWERDSIRGTKVAGGAKNSAHKTNEKHKPKREARFAVMREFISSLGVEGAAHECEARGLGKAETIVRQWNRHKNRDT